MFEATMWVTALNDQLEAFYGQSYKTARGQDRFGMVVTGVRWARNRHVHQLPVTLDKDQTRSLAVGKGSPACP